MDLLTRSSQLVNGLRHYANPLQIELKRRFSKKGLMVISDRKTGVAVKATVKSFRMFGETWYDHDYDVPACPLRPNDSVIDIGANQGFFSCYAASRGARVYAFEPSPESFKRLRSNVEVNGFSSLVTMSQAAVSTESGKATLRCSDHLGGGANTIVESHASALSGQAGIRYSEAIEVQTVPFEAVLAGIPGSVRLCKIDCEGAEFSLIPAIRDPSRFDSIAMEFHPRAYPLQDLIAIMMKWGTHQISYSQSKYIIYAVRNDILADYAAGVDSGSLPFQPKGFD
jgi:FkbM family methyltransferase